MLSLQQALRPSRLPEMFLPGCPRWGRRYALAGAIVQPAFSRLGKFAYRSDDAGASWEKI